MELTPEQRQRIDANLQQATLRRMKRLEQFQKAEQLSLKRSVSQVNGSLRVKVQYVSPPKQDRTISMRENIQPNSSNSTVQKSTIDGSASGSANLCPGNWSSPLPCARISFGSPSGPNVDPSSNKEPLTLKQDAILEPATEVSVAGAPTHLNPQHLPSGAGEEPGRPEERSEEEVGSKEADSDLSVESEDPAVLAAVDELERSARTPESSHMQPKISPSNGCESASIQANEISTVEFASRRHTSDTDLLEANMEQQENNGALTMASVSMKPEHAESTAAACVVGTSQAKDKLPSVSAEGSISDRSFQFGPAATASLAKEGESFAAKPPAATELNDAQRRAAFHDPDTPLLVLAGAGSGKTKTLIRRVLFLEEGGVEPKNMLALTFSTAATSELQKRLRQALPKSTSRGQATVAVQTFHSFALAVCREFGHLVGLPADFVVFTGGRTRKVVTQGLIEARGGGGEDAAGSGTWVDKAAVKRLCQTVVQAKAHERGPEALEGEARSVLAYYENAMRECNSLDFCSLISKASEILRSHESARSEVRERYTHLLVDEFQDTSKAQLDLIRAVADHGRITVVGDDDQTIFGFNGSNHENFDLFRRMFPAAAEVRLEHNYRSSSVIVAASRALIQHNQFRAGKSALPTSHGGELISVVECRSEQTEVAFVVADIKKRMQLGTAPSEIAILCRTKKTGRGFQAVLREAGIPFNVHGVSFWRRKVIKAVVAALRLVRNKRDDQACRRMLKTFLAQDKEASDTVVAYLEKKAAARGVPLWEAAREALLAKVCGAVSKKHVALGRRMVSTMTQLATLARSSPRLADFAESVIAALPQRHLFDTQQFDDDGFLNERRDPRTLREVLRDHIRASLEQSEEADVSQAAPAMASGGASSDGGALSGCEREIARFVDMQVVEEERSNRQIKDDNSNAVALSTIHHSKGLEWAEVYLVRFNGGELPLTNNIGVELRGMPLEEERRLCYVAVTRARARLTITHAKTLQKQMVSPSPFLCEIPAHLLVKTSCYEALPALNDTIAEEEAEDEEAGAALATDAFFSCGFLQRFEMGSRGSVALLFRRWARMPLFKDPLQLLSKVKGVLHEKVAARSCNNRQLLSQLLSMLAEPHAGSEDNKKATAFNYAQEVLAFEEAPLHVRESHRAAKARHFANQNGSKGMESKPASAKQIGYLKSLGCPTVPQNMMEASALIERYKKM